MTIEKSSFSDEFREAEHTNSYELTHSEAVGQIKKLLVDRPPSSGEQLICYKINQDDSASNIARYVETQVFEKYFGNNAHIMHEEYGPYENASRFFLTVDQYTAEPAGALRIIEDSAAGFKVFNDAKKAEELSSFDQSLALDFHNIKSLENTWEIGTVAVMPDFRQSEAAIQLYRAMYKTAMEENIKHFISAIDTRPLNKMTEYLGIPFVPLMDTQPFGYLGSASTQLVYGHVPDFYSKMSKRRYTLKGLLARKAMNQLVFGKKDYTIQD